MIWDKGRDLWGINRLFCQLWKRNRNRRVSAIMQEHLRTNVCAVLCYGLSMHCWTPWLSGSVGFRLAQGEQPVEQDTMSHHNGKQACLADTRSSAYLLWSKCYASPTAEVWVRSPLCLMTADCCCPRCEPSRTVQMLQYPSFPALVGGGEGGMRQNVCRFAASPWLFSSPYLQFLVTVVALS